MTAAAAAAAATMSFGDTGLDPRVVRAATKQGYSAPTPVQAACIPCALEGKDIVARARTGSGKTLAYLLPALHRIVTSPDTKARFQVLVLVPSRELCQQVVSEASAVAAHSGVPISITNLTGEAAAAQRTSLVGAGALVVATPGRLATALREGWLTPAGLQGLAMVVLDEADLLLSYGYEEDLQMLAPMIPRSCQVLLMSATSSEEVERLQKLVLHNPVALNLLQQPGDAAADGAAAAAGGPLGGGGSGAAAEITHFTTHCAATDKMLVTMALLKLGLVRKKVLIFVNGVDDSVRLRLFLEAFGLRLGCVHSELPVNSRSHILASFNRGLFDYLIATDDVHAAASQQQQQAAGSKKRRRGKGGEPEQQQDGSKRQKDAEFGVTRGIDFKGVRTVVNFDPPVSVEGYVHRVGRTGRAGQSGAAISLLTPQDADFQQQLEAALAPTPEQQQQLDGRDDDSSSDSEDEGGSKQQGLRPFARLTTASVEALRYRGEDVARQLSKKAVREARARELAQELLNSAALTEYFEEHEAEKALLRHDKPMHRKHGNAPHLKHLPSYLKDPAAAAAGGRSEVGGQRMGGRSAAGPPPNSKMPGVGRRPSKADPLKGLGGGDGAGGVLGGGVFMKAPKKGGAHAEELTELEQKALANPIKPSKAQKAAYGLDRVLGSSGGKGFSQQGKHNVRKVRPTMGAGATRPRR